MRSIPNPAALALALLMSLAPEPLQAGQPLRGLCSFRQITMPCTVKINSTTWTITWQDGLSESYRVLADGKLIDKRGGQWTLYTRKGVAELEHNNGNRILISY